MSTDMHTADLFFGMLMVLGAVIVLALGFEFGVRAILKHEDKKNLPDIRHSPKHRADRQWHDVW